MRLFFLLGPEFEMLQNLYSIENLPAKWKTQDWPTLLVLCHNYFNSVYSKGVIIDCIAQQKKVKKWFLNPSKHCRGIESWQKKIAGKCIYHLSKTHPTTDCFVKKECDTLLATKNDFISQSTSSVSSHVCLHHVIEDVFEDAVTDATTDVSSNDTNEAKLIYFACLANHYLCLVEPFISYSCYFLSWCEVSNIAVQIVVPTIICLWPVRHSQPSFWKKYPWLQYN